MSKRVIITLCFLITTFPFFAGEPVITTTTVQIPSVDSSQTSLPKLESYQDLLRKANSFLLELRKNILSSADKNDPKAVMFSKACADNIQEIIDNIGSLMKLQEIYGINTYCKQIFEPSQCDIWSGESCKKLAETNQKISEDMKKQSEELVRSGKTVEADSCKTASEVALDMSKIYMGLAQDQDNLSKSIEDFSHYCKEKEQSLKND